MRLLLIVIYMCIIKNEMKIEWMTVFIFFLEFRN